MNIVNICQCFVPTMADFRSLETKKFSLETFARKHVVFHILLRHENA